MVYKLIKKENREARRALRNLPNINAAIKWSKNLRAEFFALPDWI